MGAIVRRIEKRAGWLAGGSLENPANWMSRWLGGTMTNSGTRVNEHNALYAVDVLTCISKISQTMAALPLPLYKRRADGGKERARNHPLYAVLQEQANSEMTAFTFKETLQAHVDSWGNGYAWIERNADNDCVGLWPLLPDRTYPFRVNNELFYYSRLKRLPLPQDMGQERIFPARDVFHIAGLGFDGLIGYSVLEYMREQIGLAIAQEEYGARLFSNGATPPAALTVQKKLGEEDIKRIKASWAEQHQGASKAWRIAVLEEGTTIQNIGIPPQDAQLLEGQKFSRARISGFYGVPPSLMGDTDRATAWGTGIEQQMIGFMQVGIMPRAVRWDQMIDMKLLLRPRDTGYFAEFLLDALARGDLKTRYDAYAMGFGKWLTADDIREKENMNPYVAPKDELAIGKTLIWPVNFTTADRLVSGESIRMTPSAPPPGQTAPTGADEATPAASAASRRALAAAHRFSFADTADRIIRREQTDVARALKRGKAAADALATLYLDHEGYVQRQMLPVLRTYAQSIRAEIERELGRSAAVPEAFVESYAEGYAKRHVAASLKAARELVDDEDRDAVLATWSARTQWIATRETVQAGNAFAKAAYRDADVPTLIWRAGDECEACSALEARAVAIDDVFIRRGAGGPDEFIPASGLGHPPLCDGCECVILAAQKRSGTESTESAPQPLILPPPVVHVHIDQGAIQSSTPVTIAAGAVHVPVTIAEGAVKTETRVDAPQLVMQPGAISNPVTFEKGAIAVDAPQATGDLEVTGADGRPIVQVKRK